MPASPIRPCRSPSLTARIPRICGGRLEAFQKRTGAEVLAIPHNGNLSNGRMFSVNKFDGKTPYDRELAELRARLEPIYEVTQIKGDGEAHPMLSPNDEFANLDIWDKSNLNGTEAKKPEMFQAEYAREALQDRP